MRAGIQVHIIRARRTSRSPRGRQIDRTVGMSKDTWNIQVKSSRVGNRSGGRIRMAMDRITVH
eukprot:3347667-Pyramimonas_sp.AAC.1